MHYVRFLQVNSVQSKKQISLGVITIMQIVSCVLVIFGHSYPFVTEIPEWVIDIRTFIYDFHMPVFVWCSGYLFVATMQAEKYSFVEYVKRRAARILLPYFVISIAGIFPKAVLTSLINDKLNFDFISILSSLFIPREGVWGHFWFLPMIFFLGLLACLVHYVSTKRGGVHFYVHYL